MNLPNAILARVVLLSVLVLACSCSNTVEIFNLPAPPDTADEPASPQDDPVEEPVDDPQPLSIDGGWSTYASEQSDSCGFDPPQAYAPILIEEAGGIVTVTVDDGTGVCRQSTRTRVGDRLTLTGSDVLNLGGAFVRVDLNIVYDFTEDSFSGTVTQRFTDLSNVFEDLPCQVTLAVTGTRCDGCWTGCSSIQGASDGPQTPDTEDGLRELSRSRAFETR